MAVLGALEVGLVGAPAPASMPTALPALDRPIAADHSGSIVLDMPFGLRGGIPLYGSGISRQALVLATADGHPRPISYTSWVPARTKDGIAGHPFYAWLVAAQDGKPVPAAKLAAARRAVRRMDIGWVLVWSKAGAGHGVPEERRLRVRLPGRPRLRLPARLEVGRAAARASLAERQEPAGAGPPAAAEPGGASRCGRPLP